MLFSDGRHLAYAESGARKEEARYKVVFSHSFNGSRHDTIRPSPIVINRDKIMERE